MFHFLLLTRAHLLQSLLAMSALQKKDDKPVLHASGWDEVILPKPETTFYAVTGNESQVLTVKLAPGDTLHGEPGSMFYLSDGMKQTVTCDECCARCCTGEDVRTLGMRCLQHLRQVQYSLA